MVCGECGADFVVRNNRQVDQESEDTCTQEVPEAYSNKEHHSPTMRERLGAIGVLASPQLHEAPRLNSQEGQRNNLCCREERTECHLFRRSTSEVGVVHSTNHTTGGVEHCIHHDNGDSDALAHHTQEYEDVGDHHSGEEFEEVFNPQVYHPEAPELGD